MLSKQLDDFIQLFMVAVAVHKYLKLRVAPFGFSGLYVYKVDVVFLKQTMGCKFEIVPMLCLLSVPQGLFPPLESPTRLLSEIQKPNLNK